MEVCDADGLVIIDELSIRLAEAEKANADIKSAGWSGSGAVGYEIEKLKDIISKLKEGGNR
ncbi:hypothetical protein LCGC14_0732710 [marine sediment metagenome]|uniref:Uncharacterized protein n=1 Tax=marine sediment metagenome TaxID=412755 RepID=A0A0F9QTY9_9ZZZZ